MQVWTAVPVSSPGDQKQRYDTDLPLAALLVDKWGSLSTVVIISYQALTPSSPAPHLSNALAHISLHSSFSLMASCQ